MTQDFDRDGCYAEEIKHFAALVAAAEREVCAKVWAEQDEFTLRGELATLKCWPRLSGDEAADLVNFFAAHPQPKREWVGLTDEEIQEIALELPMDAVRITEAKLKEKNNG